MNKKEKQKILDSLMGFYQIICGIFEGLARIPDERLQGIVLKAHIFQLLNYHKEYTDKFEILVPDVDTMYKDYCDGYTKSVISSEELLKKMTKEYNKKSSGEGVGYYS